MYYFNKISRIFIEKKSNWQIWVGTKDNFWTERDIKKRIAD